jgi:hypothetical protein
MSNYVFFHDLSIEKDMYIFVTFPSQKKVYLSYNKNKSYKNIKHTTSLMAHYEQIFTSLERAKMSLTTIK